MALFGRKKNERAEIPVTPSVDDVLLSALLNNETITREKAMSLPAVAGAVDLIASLIDAVYLLQQDVIFGSDGFTVQVL